MEKIVAGTEDEIFPRSLVFPVRRYLKTRRMTTKHKLFCLLAVLICTTGYAQEKSVLKVRVVGAQSGDRITLAEVGADNKLIQDTAALFTGAADTVRFVTDRTDRMLRLLFTSAAGRTGQLMIFPESGEEYTVDARNGDMATARIWGGLYNTDEGMKEIAAIEHRRDSLSKKIMELTQAGRQEEAEAEIKVLTGIYKNLVSAKERFIVYHPNRGYSAYLVSDLMKSIPQLTTLDRVQRLYNSLNGGARNTYSGNKANEEIYLLIASSEGAAVPRFTLTSTEEELVSPSHFRGKWVVLDFWASWCMPCRMSNPELVRLYEKYHDRGLEVIGIACWDREDAWKKAIEDDKLPWIQLNASEKIEGQEDVIKTFVITGVPTSILVDPEGKIVYRGHPSELHEKLAEIFPE